MRSIAILFVAFFTIASADDKPYVPESLPGATVVSAEETIKLILANPDLIVIDARKKTEYIKGHIEGAHNLLNTTLTLADLKVVSPDRSVPLLFYCNGIRCQRSSDAISKAVKWGYSTIFWFRGGWKEWLDKRLPAVTK
ncbi:MAG: rhodanese-like domain-containing protein [Candidatus Thiodiazotropha sp. (ex Semelilucina semeliformis)]|nr:rhodanese-like domain-containing protein [Candidatus Thiodiazotropha sp. (ex Semelilucina semeliformis)]